MSVIALFTYDLPEDPGLYGEFKAELEARKWLFERDGKELPRTTCIKKYKAGSSTEAVAKAATTSIAEARDAVRAEHDRTFAIERFLLFVAEEPPAGLVSG